MDTHVHCWNFSKASYEWLKEDNVLLYRDFLPEEYNLARVEVGITEAILVQAANNFEDTDYMLGVAAANDWVKGVVGWVPLLHPEETLKVLENRYHNNPFFKGVRHLIHDEPDAEWLLQEKVVESLHILADHNLPFDVVGVLPHHIKVAMKLSEKIPHLKMVFDHLNQPPVSSKQKFGDWGILMKVAAQNPNLYVKISGLGNTCKNGDNWSAADTKPYIEFALEHFGTHRCFCGGDWPVSLLTGSFLKAWQTYIEVIDELADAAAQEQIYYTNAYKFYNL